MPKDKLAGIKAANAFLRGYREKKAGGPITREAFDALKREVKVLTELITHHEHTALAERLEALRYHTHGIHDAEEFHGLSGPITNTPETSRPQDSRSILRDFQQEVREWAAGQFPTQTHESIITHLVREVKELQEDPTPEEAADCFLLLLDLAEFRGFDLMNEGKRKLEICKTREWGEPDSAGVIEHIEPDASDNEDPEGEA